MKNIIKTTTILAFLTLSLQGHAQCCDGSKSDTCCTSSEWVSDRPDAHAPIGVMGDHYHHKGGLMFSYRYMNMMMDGNNRSGVTESNETIFQNYMRAPETMAMQMHMPGIMYAPTHRLTLMLMANYLSNEMSMVSMDGMQHKHSSSGFGDTQLSMVLGLFNSGRHSVHLNGGLSIPTGSITKAEMVHGENHGQMQMMRLPYPMQLGSGTWDPILGFTYLGQANKFSWGAQLSGIFRTADNSEDYRLGSIYKMTGWIAFSLNDWMSLSLRGLSTYTEEMVGDDSLIMSGMSPTADEDNFGGEELYGLVGFNLRVPSGSFEDLRFGLEFGVPFYQYLNGIQMNRESFVNVGLKYSLF